MLARERRCRNLRERPRRGLSHGSTYGYADHRCNRSYSTKANHIAAPQLSEVNEQATGVHE